MAAQPGFALLYCVIFLFTVTCIWPCYVFSQRLGDVRLVNGGTPSRGRVEYYNGQEWTTVCDDEWDNVDAEVVCRQLGYGSSGSYSAGRAHYAAYFGEGVGTIYLDNVQCTGDESQLRFCLSSNLPANCKHAEDAGVECAPDNGDVQLVGGSTVIEGRVEIYDNGDWTHWGTICDGHWDDDNAKVVCRQLGHPADHAEAVIGAYFGEGTGYIAKDQVRCTGRENRLSECPFVSAGIFCSHRNDAGVRCNADPPPQSSTPIVAGVLSLLGIALLTVLVVVCFKFKVYKSASSQPFGSRMETLGIRLRSGSRTAGVRDQHRQSVDPQDFTDDFPDEYGLHVQLNELDQQSIPHLNSPPIHVTNIALNLNFENQQVRYIPPIDIPLPPPYSPTSVTEEGAGPGTLYSPEILTNQSPPPYSAVPNLTVQLPSPQVTYQNIPQCRTTIPQTFISPYGRSEADDPTNLDDVTVGETDDGRPISQLSTRERVRRTPSETRSPAAYAQEARHARGTELATLPRSSARNTSSSSSSSPPPYSPPPSVSRSPSSSALPGPRRLSRLASQVDISHADIRSPLSDPSVSDPSSLTRQNSVMSNLASEAQGTVIESPPPYSPWKESTFV